MVKKAAIETLDTPQSEKGIITDIKKNFGIDVGDVVGSLAKDYIKDNTFGRTQKPPVNTKFGRTLRALTNAWWVPAAVYLSCMIAVIFMKFLAQLMGVEI